MKTTYAPLFAALSLLCLAGCGGGVRASASTAALLQNPLYAERYWDEMVDRMTNLQIIKDPALSDERRATYVEQVKQDALAKSKAVRTQIREGLSADFLSISEPLEGRALLLNGTLYFGSTFISYPGPALRVYLTTVTDPRDAEFPDDSSLDLGPLATPYGAQQYVLPEDKKANNYRTVVLWDAQIKRLYGFAQLAK